MRRAIVWSLMVAAALAALVAIAIRVPAVQDRVMRAAIGRMVAAQPNELFEPGRAAGARVRHGVAAAASDAREGRAWPCSRPDAFWVVDTGPGSWNRMALLRVDGARIGGVLLTHFHSDHIGDLGEFDLNTWVMGRTGPLRVYGPPGVERVVAGFEEAYALDAQYRIAHHGAELFSDAVGRLEPHTIAGPADGGGPAVVLDEDGLRITAFAVTHDPVKPAYGYRFDYGGRSVVVSGDTTKDLALIEAAHGADVLFHEAQANHIVAQIGEAAAKADRPRIAKIMSDIPSYHTRRCRRPRSPTRRA